MRLLCLFSQFSAGPRDRGERAQPRALLSAVRVLRRREARFRLQELVAHARDVREGARAQAGRVARGAPHLAS